MPKGRQLHARFLSGAQLAFSSLYGSDLWKVKAAEEGRPPLPPLHATDALHLQGSKCLRQRSSAAATAGPLSGSTLRPVLLSGAQSCGRAPTSGLRSSPTSDCHGPGMGWKALSSVTVWVLPMVSAGRRLAGDLQRNATWLLPAPGARSI